jgi:hypothetical protein
MPMKRSQRDPREDCVEAQLPALSFDGLNLDRFDLHAEFLEPRDRAFDFFAFAMQRERNEADLVGDTGLADIGDDFEFLTEFPENRLRHEPRGKHEPEALFVVHFES